MIVVNRETQTFEAPNLAGQTPDYWAVAKPAGWLVIPGRDPRDKAPVLHAWVEAQGGARAWVVHRIDRGTSGLVLFARNPEAHARANGWFEAHRVKKEYDLIAQGQPALPMLRCDSPIEGKRSLTLIERKAQGHGAFLGRARISTGRRHQIRIHAAKAGHPILGDREYGGPEVWTPGPGLAPIAVGRVALHAARLELPEGAGMFEAPWPADFAAWAGRLG